MSADIDAISASQYRSGMDPIDWACRLLELQIDAWTVIRDARQHNPNAYPVYIVPLTSEAFGRQLVGRLLDAGWSPPNNATTRDHEGATTR